jgi:predicted DNA-binding transcriptional regulator AlpA
MSTIKILVTDKQAAEMLSMGRSTFWREVKIGRLPAPIKLGGLTRWRVADLHACVAASSNSAAVEPALSSA